MRKPRGNYKPTKGGDQFSTLTMKDVFITRIRRMGSTYVFRCPICDKCQYVGADYQAWVNKVQSIIDSYGETSLEIAGPACEDCYAVMEVHVLEKREVIT